jgi:hypothetical protein
MHFANQKGNVITYVIVAMTMAATLVVGMVYMSSSSTFGLGEIAASNSNRAYFLSMAGKDYALMTPSVQRALLNGRTFTLCRNNSCACVDASCSNLDKFSLSINCGSNQLGSTGIVYDGTPFEVRRTISINVTNLCS